MHLNRTHVQKVIQKYMQSQRCCERRNFNIPFVGDVLNVIQRQDVLAGASTRSLVVSNP